MLLNSRPLIADLVRKKMAPQSPATTRTQHDKMILYPKGPDTSIFIRRRAYVCRHPEVDRIRVIK